MSGFLGILFREPPEGTPGGLRGHLHALRADADSSGLRPIGRRGLCRVAALGSRWRHAQVSVRSIRGGEAGLAFHGTLYNTRELGIPSGDTPLSESLLDLYSREGIGFVGRLHGEFALALYDESEGTLHLATDRFRVCSLFYCREDDRIVFGTRLRDVRSLLDPESLSIDPEAIVDFMAHSVVPTPRTIYKGIAKLPPAAILTMRSGTLDIRPYWKISFLNPKRDPERELARQLRAIFDEAISARLASDAPSTRNGSFLSGGIDSSTVTGVLAKLSPSPVQSFSIGFAEEGYNEIHYARVAAKAFRVDHHEYFVQPSDLDEAIPRLLEAFDEPFGNASAVPTFFCARMARDHGIESMYAGDAGDELFAGNQRYSTQRLFDYYHRIPGFIRALLLEPLASTLALLSPGGLPGKGRKYIDRASIPYPQRLHSYGFFEVEPLRDIVRDGVLGRIEADYDPYWSVKQHYFQAQAGTELDRHLYVDLKLTISDNDLLKVSRMSEIAGVRVHFPFLDNRLVEFAVSVPAEFKMRGRELRTFFKSAFADLLPAETRAKRKHGFGLPIAGWLRTDRKLRDMTHDLVLGTSTRLLDFFQKSALERIVARHETDHTAFYGTALWNLIILELWMRNAAASRTGSEITSDDGSHLRSH